jgi:hypothetical protein
LVLSRAVSAPLVFVIVNLTLSHQVEINQAFSLKKLQNISCSSICSYFDCSIVRLFDCSIVRLFDCSIVQMFYCSIVLLFYCSIVLLFYCSIVLLFYCSIVLLSEPHDTRTFVLCTNRAVAVFSFTFSQIPLIA